MESILGKISIALIGSVGAYYAIRGINNTIVNAQQRQAQNELAKVSNLYEGIEDLPLPIGVGATEGYGYNDFLLY